MWTAENRARHDRSRLRYPSDLTDGGMGAGQAADGGVLVMATLFGLHPFLLKLYADAGCQGPKFQQGLARACREVGVEIVRRCDAGKFVVLPKRWIVERTRAHCVQMNAVCSISY